VLVWLTVNGNAMSRHISYRHHIIKVCFQLDRYACALRRVSRLATIWTIDASQSISGLQPAAPLAALDGHTAVRPYTVVVAAIQTCCCGPPSYMVHWLSCLSRYYTYIFIYHYYITSCACEHVIKLLTLLPWNLPWWPPSPLAARSFIRSFVIYLLVLS